uniref:NADH-ubiquinone oxidoreductase chain 4 n=1 Tax=Melanotrichia acclivopennis TaxID=2904888 RepID=A0A9E8RT60_9NEOP|nr:NADH dehydrogenase subunit 4 [Melanotrichia acclivopennis]UZZ44151.1 NADH dehydrogenase subunit 4 [Melanotrichia acclivopennis]
MLDLLMYVFFMIFIMIMMNNWWIYMNMMNIMVLLMMMKNFNNLYFVNFSMNFSMDLLSWSLIVLSIWVCLLMIMASLKINFMSMYNNFFIFNIIILMFLLILIFLSMNIFMFYLFFEVSLIPVFLMILGWGGQVERVQAGLYLLFYTLFFSLPLLIGLVYVYLMKNTMIIYLINNLDSFLLYMILMLSFLVKMPMFLIHLWLLKAHVEAPIAGSMILAGVMLKLGGYGLMRLSSFVMMNCSLMNFYFMFISLFGGFIMSLICLVQIDMKLLIAMSSVVHMSMVIMGLMSMMYWGFLGGLILMLGHGLASSGMFSLANVLYERLSSRSLIMNKGSLSINSIFSMWWFLLICCNMAVPPSMNLLGEISLMFSIVNYSWGLMYLLMLITMFGAIYNLYLFSYTQHGQFILTVYSYVNMNIREYLLMFLHWLPLNVLMLKIDLFCL